ncbi:MAG TPA: LacI family DNA-binding transcriptional regulator [Opitutus sp.]|nr:LacI family DNA-binding transcriptional regulator [Opitutus sp.]
MKNKTIRAATLADVGRAAGVSAMAASAVLNGAKTSSRISEATRQRILDAAARLRYRPNATARALVNRRMNTIGVAAIIGEGELNDYALEVFLGILGQAAHHDQSTTMFGLHDWGRDTSRLHQICDSRIDGLILIAPMFTREAVKTLPVHTPFVSLHANSVLPNVVNIESDEERGAFEMVRHLIGRGHRRIMHIAGDRGQVGAERRIAGYRRALAQSRIRFDDSLLLFGSYSAEIARGEVRRWLGEHRGRLLPQAIFCANDGMAIGAMEALAEAGLRVPDDVSVAGFDDTLAARMCVPQLTTMRQPLKAMGARAVEVLLDSIKRQGGADVPESENPLVFPVELVERASVASPPSLDRKVP